MLSIHFIRQNPALVKQTIADKRLDLDLDALLDLDREVVGLKQQIEEMAAEVNRLSKSFGKVSKEERPALVETAPGHLSACHLDSGGTGA